MIGFYAAYALLAVAMLIMLWLNDKATSLMGGLVIPGVALGIYATILSVLGLSERLGDLADPAADEIGTSLEIERLPIRARTPKAGGR